MKLMYGLTRKVIPEVFLLSLCILMYLMDIPVICTH